MTPDAGSFLLDNCLNVLWLKWEEQEPIRCYKQRFQDLSGRVMGVEMTDAFQSILLALAYYSRSMTWGNDWFKFYMGLSMLWCWTKNLRTPFWFFLKGHPIWSLLIINLKNSSASSWCYDFSWEKIMKKEQLDSSDDKKDYPLLEISLCPRKRREPPFL